MKRRWSPKPLWMEYEMPDKTVVTSSVKLWSEEVALANASEGEQLVPKIPAYEFAGRTYYEPDTNPYTR